MTDRKDSEPVCRNVFKSDDSTTLKDRFTKKWIELINRMEREKAVSFK